MSDKSEATDRKIITLKGPQFYQACQFVDCQRDLIQNERWTAERIGSEIQKKYGFEVTEHNVRNILKSVGVQLARNHYNGRTKVKERIAQLEPIVADQQKQIAELQLSRSELLAMIIKLDKEYQTLGAAHTNLLSRFNDLAKELGKPIPPVSALPKSSRM